MIDHNGGNIPSVLAVLKSFKIALKYRNVYAVSRSFADLENHERNSSTANITLHLFWHVLSESVMQLWKM